MKKLIIISSSFPYGNSESFLRNEMHYFNVFDKVMIFPLCPNGNIDISLPQNVEYRELSSFRKRPWFLPFLFIKFLFSCPIIMFQEISCLLKHGFSFRKIYALTLRMASAHHFYSAIYKIIQKESLISLKDESYLYSFWMAEHALVALLLSKKFCFKKTITRAHGYDLYAERTSLNYNPFQHTIIKNMDIVCPISQDGKDYLRQKYHANNIVLHRLGTKDFGIEDISKIDERQIVVVSCSFCVEVKRVHLIIEALRMIDDIKVKWIHFGGGELYFELLRQADGLSDNIEVAMVGTKSNEEILQYYKDNYVDVLVNVSSSEGIPVSIMEAMSFGIPVIATRVGGTHEIVEDNKNGILLDKDFSVSDLSRHIVAFRMMPPEEIVRWRKYARQTWVNKFSAQKNYPEFFKMVLQ